jgi:hypothetical protein
MLGHTPEEVRQYRDRQKAERDHRWRISIAQEKAVAHGQKLYQSRFIRKIQTLLKVQVTPSEDLLALEMAELDRLEDELLARLQSSSSQK